MSEQRRVESRRLRKSSIALPRQEATRRVQLGDIEFVTDGTRTRQLNERHWELHVVFSLYNMRNAEINVYDIHAEEYQCDIRELRPGDIFYVRPAIVLYSDNSILQDNRVYQVAPERLLPVDLALSISRTPAGGIYYVFGLFVDYHHRSGDGIQRGRVASDCLYVFSAPPANFLRVCHVGDEGATRKILRDLDEHHKRSGPLAT